MASKGRVPPPHHRRPLPGPGAVLPDPYASAVHPPVGGFPHFEMMPHHELMAHKLSAQHIEIEKLATENQRLAASHGTLRQDLATAKHELQLIHAHIADVKSEKEQQTRGITDKMSMMESDLKAAESIQKELQQARTEAQSLVSGRQELVSKVQQLSRELQMAHSEAQQIPPLVAELDGLRQEYQHCRGTYDYEKKLYNDHLESLQVMEKNYIAMSREVEKLRAELSNSTSYDHRTGGGPYGGSSGYNGNVPLGNYASGQAYGIQQGHGSHLGGVSGVGPAGTEGSSQPAPYGSGNARDASRGPFYTAFRGTSYDPHRLHAGAGYDAQKGHGGAGYEGQRLQAGASYDAQRGSAPSAHNTPRVPGYEAQRGHRSETQESYDARKGSIYDGQGAPAYDLQRGSGDETQRGANFEAQKGASYDASSRGTAGHQGQLSMNNQPYPPTPSSRAGTGYDLASRGVNPGHR